MKNTIQITINTPDEQVKDELIACLAALNFDGFEEKENYLEAYIGEDIFNAGLLEEVMHHYRLTYKKSIIEEQNWNALWESNFEPVIVDDFCAIRAEFHQPFPDKAYDIIITPKMSFGTGHHATTYLMVSEMSKLIFNEKRVADFGTGTGILAILAEKLGSRYVCATDHDDWSIENATENIERNGCKKIALSKKEGFVADEKFDIILANINKNVILSNLEGLLFAIHTEGQLLLSGLLKQDEDEVLSAFTKRGAIHVSTVEKSQWICMLLKYKTYS